MFEQVIPTEVNRNVKSPGLDKLAAARRQVIFASQKCLETLGLVLEESVIYSDPDTRMYLKRPRLELSMLLSLPCIRPTMWKRSLLRSNPRPMK